MACKLNEIVILKSSAVQLDQDTMMLLNCMYHTADKEAKRMELTSPSTDMKAES